MADSGRASDRPETMSQARTWDAVKSKYIAAGLCHRCAAQAARGHQLGFGYESRRPWPDEDRRIKPPCERCATVVATFPVPAGAGSPWRRFRTGARGAERDSDAGQSVPASADIGDPPGVSDSVALVVSGG